MATLLLSDRHVISKEIIICRSQSSKVAIVNRTDIQLLYMKKKKKKVFIPTFLWRKLVFLWYIIRKIIDLGH